MQTVLIITGCWTLLLSLLFVVEYFFVYDLLELGKLAGAYDFWPDFAGTAILAALGGFAFGYVLVFKLNPRYSNRSFAFGIRNAALLFIGMFLVLAVVGLFVLGFLAFVFRDGVFGAARRAFENVLLNVSTPSFVVSMAVWALLVAATQFMLQVSDKFGPGNLRKFITSFTQATS
jgi:adenylate cyclase